MKIFILVANFYPDNECEIVKCFYDKEKAEAFKKLFKDTEYVMYKLVESELE